MILSRGRHRLAADPDALRHRPRRRTCASAASTSVCDLPGVGENLQDHLMVAAPLTTRRRTPGTRAPRATSSAGCSNEYLFDKGWIGKTFLEGGAFVRSAPDEPCARHPVPLDPVGLPRAERRRPRIRRSARRPRSRSSPGSSIRRAAARCALRSKDPADEAAHRPALPRRRRTTWRSSSAASGSAARSRKPSRSRST